MGYIAVGSAGISWAVSLSDFSAVVSVLIFSVVVVLQDKTKNNNRVQIIVAE